MNDPPDLHREPAGRCRRLTAALGPAVLLIGAVVVGVGTFAVVTVTAGPERSSAFVASANYVLWR